MPPPGVGVGLLVGGTVGVGEISVGVGVTDVVGVGVSVGVGVGEGVGVGVVQWQSNELLLISFVTVVLLFAFPVVILPPACANARELEKNRNTITQKSARINTDDLQ